MLKSCDMLTRGQERNENYIWVPQIVHRCRPGIEPVSVPHRLLPGVKFRLYRVPHGSVYVAAETIKLKSSLWSLVKIEGDR